MANLLPQREEYLRKKRKKRLIKYGVVVFVVLAAIGFSSYISHRSQVRISKTELSGGVLVTEDEVVTSTRDFLSGSYLWLWPKNNILWYPRVGLENYLKEKFKRIDTINIRLKNFNILSISITERKPSAIWCDKLPDFSTSDVEKCYFIDQNSTIFAEAPYFSGDAYFKYYGLITSVNPIGMEYIASSTLFREVVSFIEITKNLSIKPQYLIAKDNNEFSLVLSGGGQIYFDNKRPLSKVGQNLEALLKSTSLATSTNLDYIDLRFGNKLFYKLK